MLSMRLPSCLVVVCVLAFLGLGQTMDGLPRHVRHSTESCDPCEVTPPNLSVKVLVPVCATQGEELNYRIVIENRSPTAAHHVVVHDPLPANASFVRSEPPPYSMEPELQWKLGSIEGYGRREICLTLVPAAGEVKNCVRLTYEHGVCVCTRVATEAPEAVPIPPRSEEAIPAPKVTIGSLTLAKSGPKRAYVGSPIPYQLTVTNPGTEAATNVTITDPLPPRTVFVSASAGGRLVVGRVQWALGTLQAGESKSLELRIRGTQVGELLNEAEATADRGIRATAEARTELLGAAGLLMLLVDTRDPVEVGEETQYEIILRAQGSAAVTNIRITANVPPELAITRVQGPVDHVKDGQKVMYEALTLPAGKDTVYRIHCKGVKPGDLRFRVTLTADQLTAGPLVEEESTNVYVGNGK
jgi:uncharacterized repeat protein (TIGR01451 family)